MRLPRYATSSDPRLNLDTELVRSLQTTNYKSSMYLFMAPVRLYTYDYSVSSSRSWSYIAIVNDTISSTSLSFSLCALGKFNFSVTSFKFCRWQDQPGQSSLRQLKHQGKHFNCHVVFEDDCHPCVHASSSTAAVTRVWLLHVILVDR